jgi:hypothetical protein
VGAVIGAVEAGGGQGETVFAAGVEDGLEAQEDVDEVLRGGRVVNSWIR